MNCQECNHEKGKCQCLCCCSISQIGCIYCILPVLGFRKIKKIIPPPYATLRVLYPRASSLASQFTLPLEKGETKRNYGKFKTDNKKICFI